MECSPKSEFGLFGSLFFTGLLLGSFVFPRLSDIMGRRKVALVGNILHFVSCFVFMWQKELNFGLFLTFVIGFSMAARAFVGYLFMTENMRIKDFSYATAVMFTIDSLNIFFSSMYFKHVSRNWRGLYGIPLIFHFVAIVLMYFEKETPKFFFGIGDYK